jgi:DNA-binding transcriptional ArsR family regulator
MDAAPAQLVSDAEQLAALLKPVRLTLISELLEPNSASGLARKLGLARQKVNYHLRELERHGLVKLVAERRRGNCMERVVRATARAYVVDPAVLGSIDEEAVDRFSSAYLVAVAAQTIQEVSILREKAAEAGKKLPTLTLQTNVRFASAEQQNAFAEELTASVAHLTAKYHDDSAPEGRVFRFVTGAYPAITKPENGLEHSKGEADGT